MDFSQTSVFWDNPHEIVNNRKFDTAIRDSFSQPIKTSKELLGPDERLLMHVVADLPTSTILKEDPDHYPKLLLQILLNPENIKINRNSRDHEKVVLQTVALTYEMQMNFCHQGNMTYMRNDIIRKVVEQQLPVTSLILALLEVGDRLTQTITQSNKMYSPKYSGLSEADRMSTFFSLNRVSYNDLGLEFRWTHKYLIIGLSGEWYIMPKSVLLMYQNKICDLISVLLMCLFSEEITLPRYSYDIVVDFIKEGCNLGIQYKNKFFNIVKVLEGLVTGENLIQIEEWSNKDFLKGIVNDLYDKTGFGYFGSTLESILKEGSIPLRQEISCLSKIFGHPIVDMEAGAKSLYQKTNEDTEIDMSYVLTCVNHCKADYIQKSCIKYKKWPPAELPSINTPKGLQMAFIHGRDPDSNFIIRGRYGATLIADYVFVVILPNMRFSKLENIIHTLFERQDRLYIKINCN